MVNANGKREAEEDKWKDWRGERRSARLGAPVETQMDYYPPPKRARTDDSSLSTNSSESDPSLSNKIKVKSTGAAALKPTEFAAEQVPGRKKSKFWVYAVEPIPGAGSPEDSNPDPDAKPLANGEPMDIEPPVPGSLSPPVSGSHGTNVDSGVDIPATPSPRFQFELDRSMAGSLSPLSP